MHGIRWFFANFVLVGVFLNVLGFIDAYVMGEIPMMVIHGFCVPYGISLYVSIRKEMERNKQFYTYLNLLAENKNEVNKTFPSN